MLSYTVYTLMSDYRSVYYEHKGPLVDSSLNVIESCIVR